jgi:hypothetical protein
MYRGRIVKQLTNVEENCGDRIPTILNGKIHSKAVNKLENCIIRSPEVSENNLPLTGNFGCRHQIKTTLG